MACNHLPGERRVGPRRPHARVVVEPFYIIVVVVVRYVVRDVSDGPGESVSSSIVHCARSNNIQPYSTLLVDLMHNTR